METATEITVVLKDEHRTYRQKFLVYDNYNVEATDPVIHKCIQESLKSFGNEQPESITIKINLEVK